MNKQQVEEILREITYKDWDLWVRDKDGSTFIMCSFYADGDIQKSRKWYISPHATKSEVVLTALKMILTAEEHEARENFRYNGVRIFGPHLDVDKLVEFVKMRSNLSIRETVGVK